MTTFHDPPPQSRRAARQSERQRASDEQPAVDGFTTFPEQEAPENLAVETQSDQSVDTTSAEADGSAPGSETALPNAAQHTLAAPTSRSAPQASRPSTDAAYRTAPPPSPQTQYSSFAPPPPAADPVAAPAINESDDLPAATSVDPSAGSSPSRAPSVRDSHSPDRIPTRRELRELRARQEAELAGDAPDLAETLDSPEQGQEPALGENAPTSAPTAAATPHSNADAVPQYPYTGSAGQVSTPPSSQPLTMDPNIPEYIEPPALIDPLSVVPEAAAVSAPPEDALSAFESLLANADGSAKDAEISDSPRSPLLDPPQGTVSAKSAAELDFSGALASKLSQESAVPSSPAAEAQQPDRMDESQPVEAPRSSARSTIAGLLGFGSDTRAKTAGDETATDQSESAEPAPAVTAAQTNLSNARAEFEEQARKRLDGELPAVDSAPAAPKSMTSTAMTIDSSHVKLIPAGHWTRQAAVEDEPNDSVISRTIGSGTSTTSALVLPAIPFATDIRGPLNSSGQAMLTGSIDLPSTLSASGVSDRFDHADIDSLLDLNDSDMVSTDSAPVRAVKAVSTFSNQPVTQTQKPKGTRALTVLLISASSMAVVVAGLLVAAFAFNML